MEQDQTQLHLARAPRFRPLLYERRNYYIVRSRTLQGREAHNMLHSLRECDSDPATG